MKRLREFCARILEGALDATVLNPLVLRRLRAHGAYSWGNLWLATAVCVVWAGAGIRFAQDRAAAARVAAAPPSVRAAAWESFFDPSEVGASRGWPNGAAFYIEAAQILAMAAILAYVVPRIFPTGVARLIRAPKFFPDDLRATPLSPQAILIAGDDWPFAKAGVALAIASLAWLIPVRPIADPLFADAMFLFREYRPGPRSLWPIPIYGFAAYSVLFAVHRSLQLLASRLWGQRGGSWGPGPLVFAAVAASVAFLPDGRDASGLVAAALGLLAGCVLSIRTLYENETSA